MLCLGIETSCDETAMAMVEDGRLLGEVVASQVDVHTLFGGVVPEIASREHYRLLGPLFHDLLEKTGVSAKDIAAVAVARGPGLLGSLLVGLGFAKGMALGLRTELVGVDHLHAHLLAAGLERDLVFPSLGLLVSGGHTQIWRLDSPVQLQLMGRTLDDAAGEAFDKAAKMLNLPYPGGKYIDLLARRGTADPGRFPRPYLDNKNLDFSFSGLKTAVAEYVARHPGLRLPVMMDESKLLAGGGEFTDLADVCASFNWTVAETLRIKVERALDRETLQSLTLAGGVAANTLVRETMTRVAKERGLAMILPSPGLCTDNGAMIAYAGGCLLAAGLCHGLDLEAVPRGRHVPWDYRSRRVGEEVALPVSS